MARTQKKEQPAAVKKIFRKHPKVESESDFDWTNNMKKARLNNF